MKNGDCKASGRDLNETRNLLKAYVSGMQQYTGLQKISNSKSYDFSLTFFKNSFSLTVSDLVISFELLLKIMKYRFFYKNMEI